MQRLDDIVIELLPVEVGMRHLNDGSYAEVDLNLADRTALLKHFDKNITVPVSISCTIKGILRSIICRGGYGLSDNTIQTQATITSIKRLLRSQT